MSKIKVTAILLLLLGLSDLKGQYGMLEIEIEIPDKLLSKSINDSVLSSVLKGTFLSFDTCNFYVPAIPAETTKRILENNLLKKKMRALKVAVEWDTQRNEAIIIGCAPLYEDETKYYFYAAGSFDAGFNKPAYTLFQSQIRKEFLKKVHNTELKTGDDLTTLRRVSLSDFDYIYHINLSFLPALMTKIGPHYSAIIYDSWQLLSQKPISEDFNENLSASKTIFLCEQWSDSLVLFTDFASQATPLYYNTYYLKKEIKALGFEMPDKPVAWFDYTFYKNNLAKSKVPDLNYKFMIYDLYFQSALCRQLKLNMIIK